MHNLARIGTALPASVLHHLLELPGGEILGYPLLLLKRFRRRVFFPAARDLPFGVASEAIEANFMRLVLADTRVRSRWLG